MDLDAGSFPIASLGLLHQKTDTVQNMCRYQHSKQFHIHKYGLPALGIRHYPS